ncbi:MAG: putative Ig domain-containing protein, partial [Candidatus Acidiferrales bacterium]
PYTWSVSSGTLPTGLTLGASTGTISGSPTASGTSSFTLKVTDSSSPSQTASQTFSIAISAAASGTSLTACGTLANAGTTYVLQNDVSSTQSCFSIQADNITLNLNGYTITYNTATNGGAFGISGIACWDAENPAGNACGGSFDGFTVYGGSIVEGSGSTGTFSHCIRMGQGLNSGPTVHDTTFTFQTNSAMGIYVDYAGASVPGGAIIYNNTFHNNVTTIVSRYDIDGASIRIDQGPSVTTGAQIYNNTIIGGPQGGILDETIGGAIYGNTVDQGTVGTNQYTNDFAIYAWSENENVHNNTITPTQGRGISLDSSAYTINGTVAQGNTITVTETNDNSEYGGCELGGVYALQYDDNASGASDVGNTGVGNALKCNAVGLRLTAVGTGDTSSNNSYTGKLMSGFTAGVAATGLSMDSGGQPAFTATKDTFIGDTSSIYVDWDGAGPFTCISCTLGSGPTPTGFTTFYFWNGGTPVTPGGLHFRDTTFTGSASKTSTNMTVPGNNGQTAEYWIDWTYTLTVEDGSGAVVSGASVSITDALGNNIYSGTTNSSGQISAVVTEFRMYNSGTSATQEMHTPDAVTVSASGCTTLSYSVTVSGTMSDTRSMAGTCTN